jgi:hypothetical protein
LRIQQKNILPRSRKNSSEAPDPLGPMTIGKPATVTAMSRRGTL